MNKNFAGQPRQGGQVTILTGEDLLSSNTIKSDTIFVEEKSFLNNCQNCNGMTNTTGFAGMKNMASFANQDGKGSFWSGINFGTVLDTAKAGASIWSTQQQQKAASEQAQYALEIEKQRLAQERARAQSEAAKAEAEAAKSASVAGKIKAYSTPILITGVVVIGGIAAYFYFKKKKV